MLNPLIIGSMIGRLKQIFRDKMVLVSVVVGILLMILTIVWNVNPVEGSVVPGFIRNTLLGKVVLSILLVTCMPVWILVVFLTMPLQYIPKYFIYSVMLVAQGILFFAIGKLISLCKKVVLNRSK